MSIASCNIRPIDRTSSAMCSLCSSITACGTCRYSMNAMRSDAFARNGLSGQTLHDASPLFRRDTIWTVMNVSFADIRLKNASVSSVLHSVLYPTANTSVRSRPVPCNLLPMRLFASATAGLPTSNSTTAGIRPDWRTTRSSWPLPPTTAPSSSAVASHGLALCALSHCATHSFRVGSATWGRLLRLGLDDESDVTPRILLRYLT